MASMPNRHVAVEPQIWSICDEIVQLTNGPRAMLRRMFLTGSPAADGIVQILINGAGITLDPFEDSREFQRWRLLAHVAAVITGTTKRMAHNGTKPFGRALCTADMKAGTVNQLLTSRWPALVDHSRRAAGVLARSPDAIQVDLSELFGLTSPDKTVARESGSQIARAFYAADDTKQKQRNP